MKNRDRLAERLSDVKNIDEGTVFPGQYVPMDFALFYPGGVMMMTD